MRLRLRPRQAAAAAVLAAAGLALAGCGSIDSSAADQEAGRQLFIQSCGSCHALQDAGTTGRIGPNLDDSFRAARDVGFEESQFAGVTKRWIEIAQAPMPRNLVVGQDADDVASYVADWTATEQIDRTVERLKQMNNTRGIPLVGSILDSMTRFPVTWEGEELIAKDEIPDLLEKFRDLPSEGAKRELVETYLRDKGRI